MRENTINTTITSLEDAEEALLQINRIKQSLRKKNKDEKRGNDLSKSHLFGADFELVKFAGPNLPLLIKCNKCSGRFEKLLVNFKRHRYCPVCQAGGHEHVAILTNILRGQGCGLCASNQKKTLEDVRAALKAEGYTLCSDEYTHDKSRLKAICPNQHLVQVTWDSFAAGHRCRYCFSAMQSSRAEIEIFEYVKTLAKDVVQRDVSMGFEIDVTVPSQNLGIEYCGLYWHCELFKGVMQHHSKLVLAQSRGVKLLTVFEDEWLSRQDVVKSIIASKLGVGRKIYARSCEVKEITWKIAAKFLDENHLQGSGQSSRAFGLYYKDELVQVACFAVHHRTNKEMVWNRLANKLHTKVIGGASRLLEHAQKTLQFDEVITYADLRWSSDVCSYNQKTRTLSMIEGGEVAAKNILEASNNVQPGSEVNSFDLSTLWIADLRKRGNKQ